MAEVRIDIVAKDAAGPVLDALGSSATKAASSLDALSQSMSALSGGAAPVTELAEAIEAAAPKLSLTLGLDASAAAASVQGIAEAISALDTSASLQMDASQAIAAVAEVSSALDAIPDVTYKSVVMQYMTQASPVRPFTEGMQYIKQTMDSLPKETTHTIKYAGQPASANGAQPSAASGSASQGAGAAASFSASISINLSSSGAQTDGATLAREIDRELASLWKGNRSELRRAASL